MREILFRGIMKDAGVWVYGSLHIESGETDRNGNQTLNYRILGMRGECYYVEPETVGQYTGLTDKNGTKIFEGDIVENQYTQVSFLVCLGPYTQYASGPEDRCIPELGCPERWATVIGNIHDNPELIGGQENGENAD